MHGVVQHSVVDDPVHRGVTLVADTDSWSCQLIVVSKSTRTAYVITVGLLWGYDYYCCCHSDVEISAGHMGGAHSVKHLLQSVKGLWEMNMSPQFVSLTPPLY